MLAETGEKICIQTPQVYVPVPQHQLVYSQFYRLTSIVIGPSSRAINQTTIWHGIRSHNPISTSRSSTSSKHRSNRVKQPTNIITLRNLVSGKTTSNSSRYKERVVEDRLNFSFCYLPDGEDYFSIYIFYILLKKHPKTTKISLFPQYIPVF
jgi:hypothetical protein